MLWFFVWEIVVLLVTFTVKGYGVGIALAAGIIFFILIYFQKKKSDTQKKNNCSKVKAERNKKWSHVKKLIKKQNDTVISEIYDVEVLMLASCLFLYFNHRYIWLQWNPSFLVCSGKRCIFECIVIALTVVVGFIYRINQDEPQRWKSWEEEWIKNGGSSESSFFKVFKSSYLDAERKKQKNNRLNFRIKALFIAVLGIVLCVQCALVWKLIVPSLSDSTVWETTKEPLIAFEAILMLILFLAGIFISKILDVKKYQETWSRHTRFQNRRDEEMLRYIMNLEPYTLETDPVLLALMETAENAKSKSADEVFKAVEDRKQALEAALKKITAEAQKFSGKDGATVYRAAEAAVAAEDKDILAGLLAAAKREKTKTGKDVCEALEKHADWLLNIAFKKVMDATEAAKGADGANGESVYQAVKNAVSKTNGPEAIADRNNRVFIERIFKIEGDNIEKFCENLETKEKSLMDGLDKLGNLKIG